MEVLTLSQDRPEVQSKTRRLALLAIFLSYALIMGTIERMIPFDFLVPGVRLGLANIVILTAIYIFRFSETAALVILKCLLTAFFAGSFVSFAYSFSGSICSFLAMYILIRFFRGQLSPIGVSVVGAVVHNLGQITAASLLMRSLMVTAYLPALLISGVITGILVGIAVNGLLYFIKKHPRVFDTTIF